MFILGGQQQDEPIELFPLFFCDINLPDEYVVFYVVVGPQVMRMVKTSRLCGQAIISYLQDKGFPEVRYR